MAYPIIAAAGANASTLHYSSNMDALKGLQLIVLDAGCEYRCYASDVTRTMPLTGTFSPCARTVHDIVQRMQTQCIRRVSAGVCFHDLHLLAADIALDGLLEAGVLRGCKADIENAGTVAAFFPHGLGHHVGLEVHDVEAGVPLVGKHGAVRLEDGKRALVTPGALVAMLKEQREGRDERKTRILEANMVVTIEPGIYFCRPYILGHFLHDPIHARFIDSAKLQDYYPVGGVRIEDCILVKPHGFEILSTAPKGQELLDIINHRS